MRRTLPDLIRTAAATIREEQRASWELGDAIHALSAATTASSQREALTRVKRAEAKLTMLTEQRTRTYQDILNAAPSEVR